MKTAQKILGAFLGILGLAWLFQSLYVGGVIILISGFVVLPGVTDWVMRLTGRSGSSLINISIRVGLILIGVTAGYIKGSILDSQGDEIVQKARKDLQAKQYSKAKKHIQEAKERYAKTDNKAVALDKMLNRLDSAAFLKDAMVSLDDKEFRALSKGELDTNFLPNNSLNDSFVRKLQTRTDKRSEFVKGKLLTIADSSLGSYLKNTLIQLSKEQYQKLSRSTLDTTFIKEYPPVNELLLSKLEQIAPNRPQYLQEKLKAKIDPALRTYLMNTIGNLSEVEFRELKRGEFDTSLFNPPSLNRYFVSKLEENAYLRGEYEQRQEEARRKARIKAQFSNWDGSHKNLKEYIKQNLHDRGSFDHVETKYSDNGDHLIVRMKYRANNKLGAKVLESVTARVSLDGEVEEIISHD
jgi:hypothetical protein